MVLEDLVLGIRNTWFERSGPDLPPWKFRSWVRIWEKVTTREPLAVVTAAGSYHSRLFVAWRPG